MSEGYLAVNVFIDTVLVIIVDDTGNDGNYPVAPCCLLEGVTHTGCPPNQVDTHTKLLSAELISSSIPLALCCTIPVSYS